MINKIIFVGWLTSPAKVMDEAHPRVLLEVRTRSPAREGWEGLVQDHQVEWRGANAVKFAHYLCTGAEVYVEGEFCTYQDPAPCLCATGHQRLLVRVQRLVITGGTKPRGVGKVGRDESPRKHST